MKTGACAGAALLSSIASVRTAFGETAAKVPSYLKGYEEAYARDPRKAAIEYFRDAKFGLFPLGPSKEYKMKSIQTLILLALLAGAALAQADELSYTVSPAENLGSEKGVMRRDPSDIIRVNDLRVYGYG